MRPRGGVSIPLETLGIGRLFETVRDAVVVADAEGRVVGWNAAACEMFGHPADRALGMDVRELVPERYRARHDDGMATFRRTGRGRYIDRGDVLELPALRADGSEIVVEMTLAPVESSEGRFAVAVLRDVTERVRLTRALEDERARLEEANRALRDSNEALEAFTYIVAHDLKEPARAAEAYLEAVAETRLPDATRDDVRRALDAARRLRTMLGNLIELGRSATAPVRTGRVDVAEVLGSETCRVHFERLARERGTRVEVEPAPAVEASPALLAQVLGNVVLNAVRHTPAGSRVRMRGRRMRDEVAVDVEDDGPGFSKDALDRLASGRSGTFGLLIARRAVERLGGRIELGRSQDLGGARVTLVLPAA